MNTNITADSGGGGCFLKGTKILTAHATKKIEQIKAGDKITTLHPVSFAQVEDVVTRAYRHLVSEYLLINDTLSVTPRHIVHLNGLWRPASEAKPGDFLLDANDGEIAITSIVRRHGYFVVHNLNTATFNSFIASGVYVSTAKAPISQPSVSSDVR